MQRSEDGLWVKNVLFVGMDRCNKLILKSDFCHHMAWEGREVKKHPVSSIVIQDKLRARYKKLFDCQSCLTCRLTVKAILAPGDAGYTITMQD